MKKKRENWKRRALIAEEQVEHFTEITALVNKNGDVCIYNGSGGLPHLTITQKQIDTLRGEIKCSTQQPD